MNLKLWNQAFLFMKLLSEQGYLDIARGQKPSFLSFSIMKAAACGTWLGDLITALIVTDMMLQDNLYPHWAPSVR